jgi:hypothetical protein
MVFSSRDNIKPPTKKKEICSRDDVPMSRQARNEGKAWLRVSIKRSSLYHSYICIVVYLNLGTRTYSCIHTRIYIGLYIYIYTACIPDPLYLHSSSQIATIGRTSTPLKNRRMFPDLHPVPTHTCTTQTHNLIFAVHNVHCGAGSRMNASNSRLVCGGIVL